MSVICTFAALPEICNILSALPAVPIPTSPVSSTRNNSFAVFVKELAPIVNVAAPAVLASPSILMFKLSSADNKAASSNQISEPLPTSLNSPIFIAGLFAGSPT